MTTDLYATLRDADPAARLSGYDDAELSAMAHAIADGTGPEPSALRASRRSVPRRLVIAVPIAAAAAAALVIAPALTRSPSASADAASVLNQAADNITVVDPIARPGQWWQVSTTGTNLVQVNTSSGGRARQVSLLEARTRTDFFAVDGSRPTISVSGPASLVRQLSGDASQRTSSPLGWTRARGPGPVTVLRTTRLGRGRAPRRHSSQRCRETPRTCANASTATPPAAAAPGTGRPSSTWSTS